MEHEILSIEEHRKALAPPEYLSTANEQWIRTLLHHLVQGAYSFQVNRQHRVFREDHLQLPVEFPWLTLLDSQSKIHLMLFVCSTNPEAEEPQLQLEAIRKVCGNFMLLGPSLQELLEQPEQGFTLDQLPASLEMLPEVRSAAQKRINWLQRLRTQERHLQAIKDHICPNLGCIFPGERGIGRQTQWTLLNLVSHYITYENPAARHKALLLEASHIFKL